MSSLGVLLAVVCAGLAALPASALPTDTLLAQDQVLTSPARSAPAKLQLAPLTSKGVLERLFTTEPKNFRAEWFAPNFKIQGSNTEVVSEISSYIAQIKSQLGPYKGIEERGREFVVGLNRGSVPAQIEINPEGQITKLAFPKLDFPGTSRSSLPSGKSYRSR